MSESAFDYHSIAQMIDHSLLQPDLTRDQLQQGCALAKQFGVASVCILPYAVPWAREWLAESQVMVTTTVGFPHGAQTTGSKAHEALEAIQNGAAELDMVVNISLVKSQAWQAVRRDLVTVIELAHQHGVRVKVIFENCYLNENEKIGLCQICTELEADWVKTSTGYGKGGATPEDVILMRREVGPNVQVKAAGGIRDLNNLLAYRQLGVTRIGASKTADILNDLRCRLGLPVLDVTQSVSLSSAAY